MSTELDMTQYLDLFLQEADEQLEILEQETLRLETDASVERLQIIFRAAHTLKGSSRAMGFQRFAQLTHEMENVLDRLRNNELALATEIADALLACIDTLGRMVTSIRAGQGDEAATEALVTQLQDFLGIAPPRKSSSAADPVEAGNVFQTRLREEHAVWLRAARGQKEVYHARFRLVPDCVMKFVRAFMAISILQEQGELLVCIPDRERLEEEDFDREFELFVHNEDHLEAVLQRLHNLSEVEWCDYTIWEDPTGPESSMHLADETEVLVEKSDSPGKVLADAQMGSAAAMPPIPGMTTPTNAPIVAAANDVSRKPENGQTVRVDVTRLDNLMNLVGELVIDRTRIAQIGADLSAKYSDTHIDALAETVGHIARITSDLQDQLMKARMMPIETVFNRFPRVVRDLAQKLGKEIKLDLVGGETELDRSVIEVIGDPLLHIIRNSLDHGLESPEERELLGKSRQGNIVVSARHQENHIIIEIIDDGRGIDTARIKEKAVERGLVSREAADRLTDKEILQFIFASGLSTATTVSEVSGRGVGMDIVKSNIQKLGGLIDLETTAGQGTRLTLRLPLTLAIIRGLLVRVSGVVYVVPLGSVIETLLIHKKQIHSVNQREVIVIRGMTTPLIRMRTIFTTRNFIADDATDASYVVIVGIAEQRVGLVVDSLIGEQEVVIKSLSRFCGDVRGVSGATILGDGNVALIVDVNGVVTR